MSDPLEGRRTDERILFDCLPAAVLVLDVEGQVVDANPAASRFFDCTVEELLGAQCGQMLRFQSEDGSPAQVEGRISTFSRHVLAIPTPTGATVVADCTVAPFPPPGQGPLQGWQVVLREPADARLSDEELLTELASAVDAASQAIIACTPDGTVQYWNREAEELFGYPSVEAIGKDGFDFLVPADRKEERDQLLQRLWAGSRFETVRTERVRRDGSKIDVTVNLTSIKAPDGSIRYVIAIVRNLSQEERDLVTLARLMDASPDALLCLRSDGTVALVNHRAEQFFGYDRGEMAGGSLDSLIGETTLALTDLESQSAVLAETRFECAARRRDGTVFPAEVCLAGVDPHAGIVAVASIRDVTDRRRLEAEQAQLLAEVQRAQQEEERALIEAQIHQSQRLESIGQLAGGIAHDFNNLLAAMTNYASLARSALDQLVADEPDTPGSLVSSAREDLEAIGSIAARAAGLTRQLLIFSRRETVQPAVVDLNSVVAELSVLLKRIIRESVVMSTRLEPDLPSVLIDPAQLEQVIMNLAVNARDAMAERGGRLDFTTSRVAVDDDLASRLGISPGDHVRLTVSDTGVGMEPGVRERALEPFFSTKARGEGTGLGLATVYGIVTRAGGNVTIYSEAGLGTTVRVLLPVVDGRAEFADKPTAVLPRGSGETILLVEDEKFVREPTRRMLESHGYTVLTAAGPQEALAVVAAHDGPVDLMLTDVVMPGGSGKELVAALTAGGAGPAVLYMSGYPQDIVVHHGIVEEGVHLLEKPFTTEELLSAVRECLETARPPESA